MTNPNDSAHPEIFTDLDRNNPQMGGDTYSAGGLTKREYFTSLAMQGLIANPDALSREDVIGGIAFDATRLADALIEALNK